VKASYIASGFLCDFNIHVADLRGNGPRSIFRQYSRDRLAHAEDGLAERDNLQSHFAAVNLNAIRERRADWSIDLR
jgi:hypothetical protein